MHNAVVVFAVLCTWFASAAAHHTPTRAGPAIASDSRRQSCAGPTAKSFAGIWSGFGTNQKPTGNTYDLVAQENQDKNFYVVLEQGKVDWTLMEGVVSEDGLTMQAVDNPTQQWTASVSDDCDTLLWTNSSGGDQSMVWRRQSGVEVVHIVAMNHLDVGYNGIPKLGLINNILNRYFALYFPRAIAIAQALRALDGEERLIYTTHPWLVSMYLNCPEDYVLSGIALECPSAEDVTAMRAALVRGDIAFHAGPFNSEYENAVTEEAALSHFWLAQSLADDLGIARPTVVSVRDVPGVTRAIIPLMASVGIRALSVGVNSGSPAPAMPNPGVWLDQASNTSILFMQTAQGQGYPGNPGPSPSNPGGMSNDTCVKWPGLAHVLCFAFRTDNSGPPESVEEVMKQWDIAHWQFPGAKVQASTFDRFVDELSTVRDALPVETREVGDNWITSTTADPVKMAWNRLASREYSACVQAKQCDLQKDTRVQGFIRQLMKLPEHTYGLPAINDDKNYTNAQFEAAYQEAAVQNALLSYTEQRVLAFKYGMEALADHPLASRIKEQWAEQQPSFPDTSALKPIPQAQWSTLVLNSSGASIGMDGTTGALSKLVLQNRQWADAAHPVGQYLYQTFNTTVYAPQDTCCWSDGDRQNITHAQATDSHGTMTELWANDRTLLAVLSMPTLQHEQYGAPETATLNVTLAVDGSKVYMDLQLFNCTRTRLGGAHMFGFTPLTHNDYTWRMDKLGSWVDPLDVIASGSQHQHAVKTGVQYCPTTASAAGAGLMISTVDASVMCPATESQPAQIFQIPLGPLTGPVTGFSAELFQNAFSTNTPLFQWDGDYRFRFVLSSTC